LSLPRSSPVLEAMPLDIFKPSLAALQDPRPQGYKDSFDALVRRWKGSWKIYVRQRRRHKKGTNVSKGHIKVIAQWYGHHEKVFREGAKQRRKRIDSWANIVRSAWFSLARNAPKVGSGDMQTRAVERMEKSKC
jgi:hypothetical protein